MAYPRKRHWFRMLFEWRGSVLRVILPRLGLFFLLSVGVVWTGGHIGRFKIPLTIAPFTVSGLAISIFLGFRKHLLPSKYLVPRRATRDQFRPSLDLFNLAGWTLQL